MSANFPADAEDELISGYLKIKAVGEAGGLDLFSSEEQEES